jgi:hypothetical protein
MGKDQGLEAGWRPSRSAVFTSPGGVARAVRMTSAGNLMTRAFKFRVSRERPALLNPQTGSIDANPDFSQARTRSERHRC